MTKKIVLWLSSSSLLVFVLLCLSQINSFCYNQLWCNKYWGDINKVGNYLYFSIPIFILSLITYFLKEQIFRTWLHFAYGWIPLSLLFVYIASQSSGGGFGIPNVFDTESVSIIFSVLFFIISILLIFIKSFITKSK